MILQESGEDRYSTDTEQVEATFFFLTLIGTKLMNEETELVKETDRILIIKITINNVIHTVVNCDAPNTTIEKINFLHQLQQELQDTETDSLW